MREHEAGRSRAPWRWHSWFKRISQAATQLSLVSLFGMGGESSLAASKNKRRDDRGGDQPDRDRDRGGDREGKLESDRKGDGRSDREKSESSNRDGDGRDSGRERRRERQDDESGDASSAAAKQKSGKNKDDESGNPDDGDDTSDPDENADGGGGGGRGDGARGNGGGNDAGNAGSGLFDSPLATKARRRADEVGNAGGADEDDGVIVDVDPEGESVYETDSISFATGPQGIELLTDNITYFAEPPPPPEPLPRLELPVREPGFPFGEDFPFGNAAATVRLTEPEPSDPGDTGPAPTRRAEPISAADEPEPASSDGGDNTMDFAS